MTEPEFGALVSRIRNALGCSKELASDYATAIGETPEIENGKVNGNEFSWIVKRDRPNGEMISYRMTGKVEGDTITARAKTTLDGNEATSEWSAKRK